MTKAQHKETAEPIGEVADRVVEKAKANGKEPPLANPTNIGEAICAIMAELNRLKKADHNTFANYDFTSVDDFKDEIRPLMAKYGLYHHMNQDVFAFVELKDKNGRLQTMARFDFLITLKHVSGETEPPEPITVVLPFTGAQTSGAARSYALKECLMKGRFMASSGDMQEEADLIDNSRGGTRLSKAEARPIDKQLREEMREVEKGRDHEALAKWWSSSKERLDVLPMDWFLKMKQEYGDTWKELKAAADLDAMSNEELDRLAQQQEAAQSPLNAG